MRSLRAALLYALLTVAMLWPIPAHLRQIDAGDSAYFAWVMAWELHALGSDPRALPHANIFHPHRYALGLDEPVFGTTLLIAPLRLFTDDAVLGFQVARLLTFLGSALAAYACARGLGLGDGPALLAGAGFAFSPIRTDQIAHLSTLGTQWLPLVLLFLYRFGRSGQTGDALKAAAFFVLSGLACGYHAVMGLALLPLAALPILWGRARLLPKAAIAIVVAAAGLYPLYLLHRAALAPLGYSRGEAETRLYSASLETFLAASSWNRVYGEASAPFRTTFANNLFPGLVVVVLPLAAGVALLRHRRRPGREALSLVVLALAAAALALGPEIKAGEHVLGPGPLALLREVVPTFRMIRVSSRAGIFLALALALLAAKAAQRWQARPVPIAALTALVLLEGLIAPVPTPAWALVVDTRQAPPGVYPWLAAQPGDFPIVHLPMLDIEGLVHRPAYHESVYMVRSTTHWKRLVNGYAGPDTPLHREVRARARRFPSEESLADFQRLGVRYVVLHRGGFGPNQWARIERDLPAFADRLKEAARFEGDVVLEIAR